jgi:hypothetical protein
MRGTTAALAATLAATVVVGFTGTASANRGNDAETVLDDCDPETFNAAIGPGTCVGDGDTTFEEFINELATGGDGHWKNNPRQTDVSLGEGLHLVNRGGEAHTFTKVADFADGGCVPEINALLGVPSRDPGFCFAAFSDPVLVVGAGAESAVPASLLEVGHNHFQCMIHPWMQTTVHVDGHDHD